jgi:hypothetical protein
MAKIKGQFDWHLFWLVLSVGFILLILLSIGHAKPSTDITLRAPEDAPVCFADAYGVRRHSPKSWPQYTLRMAGHKGERCWYPGQRQARREVMPAGSKPTIRHTARFDVRPRSMPAATTPSAGAAPLTESDLLGYAERARLFEDFERWRIFRELDQALGIKSTNGRRLE